MGQPQKNQKEPLDYKDVQNGPMSEANRQCRDVLCCLLFFANVAGMIYVTIYAYMNGNPYNAFRGTDSNNQHICGIGTAANYPYIYFYDPLQISNALTNRVCVSACPSIDANGVLSPLGCVPGVTCTPYSMTFDKQGNPSGNYSTLTSTPRILGYQATVTIGRVCIPSLTVFSNGFAQISSNVDSTISSALSQGYLAQFITDIQNNWQWLLCALGFALVFSFLYMFLLRCLVGIMVWGSILLLFVVLIGMGIIFLYNGGAISSISYLGYLGIPTLSGSQYYNIYGYICFGLTGVLLILFICCCSRIRLAVAICKCAGQYVVAVYLIVFIPVIMTLLTIGVWVACIAVMVYIISSAQFSINGTDVFTSFSSYTQQALVQFYYFVFAVLWVNATIGAISIFVIASSCCMWYYNHGAGESLDFPILRSFKMAFRYHFGSLAFGAFILALIQFMQFLVEVFKKHAEATGQDNKCLEYVINCLRCCLACVERIVSFLNKTAYIQIALRGKNFCYAAKDGFQLVWSNGLRYAIVTGVGEIVMFIGKLLIAGLTTAAFYCLITFVPQIKSNITTPLLLLLLVFVSTFFIALIFMSVYSIAMDTLLACFIVDQTNQKAKGGKAAQYAPQQLAGLMDTD